jgi:hypothetical protein
MRKSNAGNGLIRFATMRPWGCWLKSTCQPAKLRSRPCSQSNKAGSCRGAPVTCSIMLLADSKWRAWAWPLWCSRASPGFQLITATVETGENKESEPSRALPCSSKLAKKLWFCWSSLLCTTSARRPAQNAGISPLFMPNCPLAGVFATHPAIKNIANTRLMPRHKRPLPGSQGLAGAAVRAVRDARASAVTDARASA